VNLSEFEESVSGSGRLLRGSGCLSLVSFLAKRERHNPESEWAISGYIADVSEEDRLGFFRPGFEVLTFEGVDNRGRPIFAPMLHLEHTSGRDFKGSAQELRVGEEKIVGDIGWQVINCYLWETPIAQPEVDHFERWWTGELRGHRLPGSKKAPINRITFSLGRFRFSLHFDFEVSATPTARELLLRIPRPTLYANLTKSRRDSDIRKLLLTLESELDDFTRVLTFLSRRHVRWSRMTVMTQMEQNSQTEISEYARIRGSRSSHRPRDIAGLINPYRLDPDALDQLFQAYRSLPTKKSVGAAIIYIIAAYDSVFVDAKLATAYTAFEAVVSALSEQAGRSRTLSSNAFHRLSRALKKTISEFAVTEQLLNEEADALTAKLPELQRRPIVNQAVMLIETMHVQWQDLWPAGLTLQEVIQPIFARRNRFIHAGDIGHVRQATADSRRLLVLTERLIFALLGGNTDWFDFNSFRHADFLFYEPEPTGE